VEKRKTDESVGFLEDEISPIPMQCYTKLL